MADGFRNLSIRSLQDRVGKDLSPQEVARICIDRVNEKEEATKAWVTFEPEKLLEAFSDKHLSRREKKELFVSSQKLAGNAEGAKRPTAGDEGCEFTSHPEGGRVPPFIEKLQLFAVPVGIKDIMNTTDFPTEMGSPLWKDFTPGNDARVVFSVKQAGAIVAGKTVTAEFAVHTLGKTLNPHDRSRNPGTSSSGSAAAVAQAMVPMALGTQTAGSIVRPASFCGVYGCKPSFGLIPRTGMLKTTDSLDTVGFFSYHYEDILRIFEVLRVRGFDYPLSNEAFCDSTRQVKPNRPWQVGFVKNHTWKHVPTYAKKKFLGWVEKISKLSGVEVVEAKLPPEMEKTHDIHSRIYDRSLAYYFQEEYKKKELVSPIMNEIIARGNTYTVEQYQSGLREQEQLAWIMDDYFKNFDILLSLSTSGAAPLREEREKPDSALMWTMTHLPVISAPVFTSPQKLPFGAQILARRYNDYLLFSFTDLLRANDIIPPGPYPQLP